MTVTTTIADILRSTIPDTEKVELLATHGYTATGRSCHLKRQILASCRHNRKGFSHRYIDTTDLTKGEYLAIVHEWFLGEVAKHHHDNSYCMLAREYTGLYHRVRAA